jgi:hypothetical protein
VAYEKNVFVNCPFDNDYYPLLKSLLFTVIYFGYTPKLAETRDGDEIRIRQIQSLIKASKYSIHDLSRIIPKSNQTALPRFNMPFELGLDLGCKYYLLPDKKCLILEEEAYRYKEVISDIGGQDIHCHYNNPKNLMKSIRDWLYYNNRRKIPSYAKIWDIYNEFIFDFDNDMKKEKMNPNKIWEIPFSELIDTMTIWIESKR